VDEASANGNVLESNQNPVCGVENGVADGFPDRAIVILNF
jgi:hypothetical protein